MNARSDSELVAGLRRGDASAFEELYRREEGPLFNFLLRLTGRPDLAKDLYQETWARFARHTERLRDGTRLRAWLFTVARNLFYTHLRDYPEEGEANLDEALNISQDPGPDRSVEARQEIERMERALRELPAATRELLLLAGVEGMEPSEIAELLGIQNDACRQRIARARDELIGRLDALERSSAA